MTYGVGDLVSRLAIFAANCGQSAESDPTPSTRNPGIWTVAGWRLWPSNLAVALRDVLAALPTLGFWSTLPTTKRNDLSEAGAGRIKSRERIRGLLSWREAESTALLVPIPRRQRLEGLDGERDWLGPLKNAFDDVGRE